MLVEFTVGNYRSFRDLNHFSLVAANLKAKDKTLDERNTFSVDKSLTLLKSAAIYGANASGKSNLVAAMRFMNGFVVNSSRETQIADLIPTQPFRLDSDTPSKPSFFEMVFLLDGRLYRYGFEVDAKRVVSEWLFYVPKTKEARLFERRGNEYKLSEAFKEGRDLEGRTRENALFLSVVAQFNGPIASKVLSWFQSLHVLSGLDDRYARMVTEAALANGELRDGIVRIVRELDLGIDGIELEESHLRGQGDADIVEVDGDFLARALKDPNQGIAGEEEVGQELVVIKRALDEVSEQLRSVTSKLKIPPPVLIRTKHRVYNLNGEVTGIELFDVDQHESQGTRKLIALAGPLVLTLLAGTPLVIDELDARLHPLITCAILAMFHSPETNPHNAQLIFTTQDTNLLNHKLLRRDQIWFVEKDRQAASTLYSLAEFRAERRVRNDASFETDYIHGKYGAVPFLGDLQWILGERHE